MTAKTRKGKVNYLIDMLFHGHGRVGYIIDEWLHTLNEGKFSWRKFKRYGNASRIFGIKRRRRRKKWF